MLKIWGRTSSSNVQKVLWAAGELGLDYERIDAGGRFGVVDTPQYRAINPMGRVPTIEDDGFVLWESNAILRYLAAKHGAEALYPADPAARHPVEMWMDWVAYDVTHALRGAFLGGQLREPPWNNDWFVAQGRKDLTDLMRLLDAHLAANGPYVTGETFTIADIPAGLVVNRWFSIDGLDRPDLPALAAYYELLSERPAYRAHGRNGLP